MKKDYKKLIEQMNLLIEKANQVITEASKEKPDAIEICNLACEDIWELSETINRNVLGDYRVNLNNNSGVV